MAIDGVSGRTSFLGSSILNIKSQLDELQQQLATGKVSNTYAGQGVGRGFAVGLRAEVNSLDAYADTANNINTRVNVANLSLQGLVDIGSQVKTSATGSAITLGANGQTTGQVTAQAQLGNALALLNTQSGGRYLFSGRATDTPATASADDILNGSGVKAGLTQLIAERKQADQGVGGSGRLTLTTPTATSIGIANDASPFGLKLSTVSSSLTGATLTPPSGAPSPVTVDLGATNPTAGDKVKFTFTLPDGSSESIELTASTATPLPPGAFAIGATSAATAANLNAALTGAVGTLANTSLVAASAIAASNNFFDAPPLRVAGPPFNTATALVNGTAANTVSWYTGETGTDPARGTAVAQIDQSITVQYGARADEQAFRTQLQNIAVYAAVTTSVSDPNANAEISALNQRVAQNLSPQTGQQSVQDIQADFAGVQIAIKATGQRQAQGKSMAQTMLDAIEGASPDEVATKILALQTSLTASYQTTAMLYQNSLTKFLPIG